MLHYNRNVLTDMFLWTKVPRRVHYGEIIQGVIDCIMTFHLVCIL